MACFDDQIKFCASLFNVVLNAVMVIVMFENKLKQYWFFF